MLCRLVGKGHNMPVPLHLETKWHYAILAQGAEVGEEISLPLELACCDLSSFFWNRISRHGLGLKGEGTFGTSDGACPLP